MGVRSALTRFVLGFRIEGDRMKFEPLSEGKIDKAKVSIINRLTTFVFVHVADSDDGWQSLYRDPFSGVYWRRAFVDSDYHGGGYPTLDEVNPDEIQRVFGVTRNDR